MYVSACEGVRVVRKERDVTSIKIFMLLNFPS